MYVVLVRLEARPDTAQKLFELARYNSEQSRKEPGNLRFDVLRAADNPLKFALVEVYRDEAAFQAHQQTPHYARWRAEVGDLLAAPRTSEKYVLVAPAPGA